MVARYNRFASAGPAPDYVPAGVGAARLGWPRGGENMARLRGKKVAGWEDPTIPTLLVMLIIEIILFDLVRAMTRHAG
jgi:hypothetical protein